MNKQGLEKFYNTLGKKMFHDRWGLDVTFDIMELPSKFKIKINWNGPLIIRDPQAKGLSDRYASVYSDVIPPLIKKLNRFAGGLVDNKILEYDPVHDKDLRNSLTFVSQKVNDLNAWLNRDLESFIKINGPKISRNVYVSKLSGIMWVDNPDPNKTPITPFLNGVLLSDFLNFRGGLVTNDAKEEIIQTFG